MRNEQQQSNAVNAPGEINGGVLVALKRAEPSWNETNDHCPQKALSDRRADSLPASALAAAATQIATAALSLFQLASSLACKLSSFLQRARREPQRASRAILHAHGAADSRSHSHYLSQTAKESAQQSRLFRPVARLAGPTDSQLGLGKTKRWRG